MDRAQLLNDAEEAMRLVLDGRQSILWTSLPGIVTKVTLAAMTCEIQPAIQGSIEDENGRVTLVNLPLLLDVPIVFPSAGGFALTFPIAVGDEVLVVMASRCIDAWWQAGGIQRPMEARMHDLSDGFAIPGPKSTPHVISSIDAARVALRNNAGTVYLSVGTKFAMKNATTNLKSVLDDLNAAVNGFMTTIAALSLLPPGTPVTNTMIGPAGTSAVAALAAVSAKITALLEAS